MITYSALITRAIRKARDGSPATEVKLYEDNVELLIPNAEHSLAIRIAHDARRRDLLMSRHNIPLTDGQADISGLTILTEALQYSILYAEDDPDMVAPYIWKRNPRELDRWLNPAFGYYSERDGTLLTRYRGDGDIASSKINTPGPVALFASSIIPFSRADFPNEINDEAVEELTRHLLELRAS
jgi:hypothetical protein